MPSFLTPLLGFSLIVLIMELLLWALFRRRAEGVVLPRAYDRSSIRWISYGGMRAFACAHTIILLILLFFAFFFLW